MNMFAYLLGALSNIRFTSVSDRFAAELDAMNRVAYLRDQKDGEARLGYLIRGVQFLKLKVYPLEALLRTLPISSRPSRPSSRHPEARLLRPQWPKLWVPLLAQVVQSATAEVNHPVGAKQSTSSSTSPTPCRINPQNQDTGTQRSH
ncbi:hypothetical protein PGTUg99_000272 [Puccinia graminis f. sp. tritici]|uniref:Cell morphogenesis protein N-terminal domain-containing protein n=1 Tax=Puccinia graminis f. sp. tritici TaxID=56615 RepID=A0A5B0SFB3_PUCGR|nr:hypothetical protein PGTUg99_000272 [Puccinia graminis f. sp. tritici]